MTPPNPIPLREVLLCEASQPPDTLLCAIILREGITFTLLDLIRGDHCSLISDPRTLKLLEREFNLPTRVLDGVEGPFLGAKTLLAHKNGTSYSPQRTSLTR